MCSFNRQNKLTIEVARRCAPRRHYNKRKLYNTANSKYRRPSRHKSFMKWTSDFMVLICPYMVPQLMEWLARALLEPNHRAEGHENTGSNRKRIWSIHWMFIQFCYNRLVSENMGQSIKYRLCYYEGAPYLEINTSSLHNAPFIFLRRLLPFAAPTGKGGGGGTSGRGALRVTVNVEYTNREILK